MFDVGSMPPDGYIAWHLWADVQIKGGLKQSQCGECDLWYFPQEAINHAPNTACTRRAEVVAQKVSSNKKGSAKPARG